MMKEMKLQGRITLENDHSLTFSSTLYDSTPFSLRVDQFDVERNDEFLASRRMVDGWLYVTQEAKQGDRVYLTLPKPTIQFGKQIVVRDLQLMPRSVSLADFHPQKK